MCGTRSMPRELALAAQNKAKHCKDAREWRGVAKSDARREWRGQPDGAERLKPYCMRDARGPTSLAALAFTAQSALSQPACGTHAANLARCARVYGAERL